MEPILKAETISYQYPQSEAMAVDDLSFAVQKGEFIAILGHNGSGKSTLAKHLNALLKPSKGTVWVKGLSTGDDENVWAVRQLAGMVFQNPDNQIVSAVVEEDVAFGPENLGIDPPRIRQRVDEALRVVKMENHRAAAPSHLSGGQKQRIAIAGILAMEPEVIILDEPTAMLDPEGRSQVMETVHMLNREHGITVIHITHYMDEAVGADRVFVMRDGKVALDGPPREVFRAQQAIREAGLELPDAVKLAGMLRDAGVRIGDVLTIEELAEELCRLKSGM
mgnify:CR=1 FL=1